MENEEFIKGINVFDNNESSLKDEIFKLDYLEQNLDNNIEFQKWKELMINKYGKNSKIFKCSEDKILFFVKNEDCKRYPFYKCICPICKHPVCYFCYRYSKELEGNGTCCLKRRFICMFLQDGYRLISPIGQEYDFKPIFSITMVIYFFLPTLNLLFLILEIQTSFFLNLATKNAKTDNNGFLENYLQHFKRNHICFAYIITTIVGLFCFALNIAFYVQTFYLIILILLISIPFKFYPMKYYMGIVYGRIELD